MFSTNMHDTAYLRGEVGPEITAAMTVLARAVKEASGLPCGIQMPGSRSGASSIHR
jgi:uncharacterized protein